MPYFFIFLLNAIFEMNFFNLAFRVDVCMIMMFTCNTFVIDEALCLIWYGSLSVRLGSKTHSSMKKLLVLYWLVWENPWILKLNHQGKDCWCCVNWFGKLLKYVTGVKKRWAMSSVINTLATLQTKIFILELERIDIITNPNFHWV